MSRTSTAPFAGEGLLRRFRRRGALLEGHFLLSSGLHSPLYFQSALLLQHPREAAAAGSALAVRVREALAGAPPGPAAPVVVSPALGGLIVGHELARALGSRAVFAERREGRLTLRRGFRVDPAEPAVVCEDVITTGGSAREVAELLRADGARVVAVAALIQRGPEAAELGVPLVTLARLEAPAYSPASCPLCAAGSRPVKPGSRGTNAPGGL
ncbi:MAG: orotate phosphoribosyltransferase [Gemmatimonadota bacterium]